MPSVDWSIHLLTWVVYTLNAYKLFHFIAMYQEKIYFEETFFEKGSLRFAGSQFHWQHKLRKKGYA